MNRTTCPICSDYFTVRDCTACPCGHTFHLNCIQRWKVESSTCPQCRVKFKEPIKLFFEQNCNDTVSECDTAELKNEIRELKLQVTQKDVSINALTKQFEVSSNEVSEKVNQIAALQKMLRDSQGTNDALKRQLLYLEKYKAESQRARAESARLEKELCSFQNIKEMVNGERYDVESMVKRYADSPDSMNAVVKSFVLLKKEFDKMKEAKKRLERDKNDYRRKAELASQEAHGNQKKVEVLSNDLSHLNEMNKSLQQKLRKLEQSFASPSPRSSAIKRLLMESPAPLDMKRPRMSHIQEHANENNDGSIILFDDVENELLKDGNDDSDNNIEEELEDEDQEMLKEFGLTTTSIASTSRNPLTTTKLLLPNNRLTSAVNKFPLKISNKLNLPLSKNESGNNGQSASLPHTKKGYNGLGGQSKVLYLPKKTIASGFKKPSSVKNEHRKILKVSRNNRTISKLLSKAPKLPTTELSP